MARNPLPYRVECQNPPSRGFEPIAAFNVQEIAERYARDCYAANLARGLSYRVTARGKTLRAFPEAGRNAFEEESA